MARDYYEVLGIARGASAEEVKKAYRKMSKELHPDKHKGNKDAEQRFKEVNEAYEVLSNPQKKQMYDQFGEAGVKGGAGGGGPGGGQGFGGFDFSGFGDASGLGDIFESFFGGGGGGRRAAEQAGGRNMEAEIVIDFAEVVTGAKREVKLHRLAVCDHCSGEGAEPGSKVVSCSECGGTGQVTRTAQSFFGTMQQRVLCSRCRGSGKVPERACKKCSGEGRIQETQTLTVEIPAGIDDGQRLRIKGQGEAGRRKSAAGDLFVLIHVRDDKRFVRDGADIRSFAMVSALDAILGTEITIDTVQGKISLKVPEGTQPDQILRLKGKGLPVLNTSRFGDHFVTVKVQVPTKLSREERRILEEWKRARG